MSWIKKKVEHTHCADKVHECQELVKNRIRDIEYQYARGNVIRSRAKWALEGERNTKYFYSLEKRNYLAKTMKKVIVNGKPVTDQEQIRKEQYLFYKELYTAENDGLFSVQNNTDVKVSGADLEVLNADLEQKECYDAIKSMDNNKAPGLDGLPVEFYKIFWADLKDNLMELYAHCYEKSKLN